MSKKYNDLFREKKPVKDGEPFRNTQIHSLYRYCVRYTENGRSCLGQFKTLKEAETFINNRRANNEK